MWKRKEGRKKRQWDKSWSANWLTTTLRTVRGCSRLHHTTTTSSTFLREFTSGHQLERPATEAESRRSPPTEWQGLRMKGKEIFLLDLTSSVALRKGERRHSKAPKKSRKTITKRTKVDIRKVPIEENGGGNFSPIFYRLTALQNFNRKRTRLIHYSRLCL